MKAPIRLKVKIPNDASQHIPRIISRVASELSSEDNGKISHSATGVEFHRSYPLLPFSYNPLALFDSGKIKFSENENVIDVDGVFEIRMGQRSALLALGILVLFIVSRHEPIYAVAISSLTLGGNAILIFLRLVAVKRWLKEIIVSAVV